MMGATIMANTNASNKLLGSTSVSVKVGSIALTINDEVIAAKSLSPLFS